MACLLSCPVVQALVMDGSWLGGRGASDHIAFLGPPYTPLAPPSLILALTLVQLSSIPPILTIAPCPTVRDPSTTYPFACLTNPSYPTIVCDPYPTLLTTHATHVLPYPMRPTSPSILHPLPHATLPHPALPTVNLPQALYPILTYPFCPTL